MSGPMPPPPGPAMPRIPGLGRSCFQHEDEIWLSDINEDELLNILDIIALVNIILDYE